MSPVNIENMMIETGLTDIVPLDIEYTGSLLLNMNLHYTPDTPDSTFDP